jgi:spore germination protein GerM
MTDRDMAEKKKPAAKKKAAAKKPPVKKTQAVKKASNKKTVSRKPQNRKPAHGSSFNPAYVLTIMVLLTVIVFLVNNLYFRDGKSPAQSRSSNEKISVKKPEWPEKSPEEKGKEKEEKSEKSHEVAEKRKVMIYFVKFNERTEKSYLTSVKRRIDSRKPVEAALNELIKGLSPYEERKGLLTAVPEELKLHNVRMRNRTAELDFNSSLQWGATGNILLNRIDQIVYTATQFDNVDSVIIKINGRTQRTLGADGLSISGPLQRRVY